MSRPASELASPAGRLSSPISRLGDRVLSGLEVLGDFGLLVVGTFRSLRQRGVPLQEVLVQFEAIAVRSTPIVAITALFTGMVLALQTAFALTRFGAKPYVGSIVGLAIVRELGPVLAALMVGGRVGAGITSELGSMKVTEQVDAIRAMGADPVSKLVLPRVIAATLGLPLLSLFAIFLGVFGGLIVADLQYQIEPGFFIQTVTTTVTIGDFFAGVVKTFVFGWIIAMVGCFTGLRAGGGTAGVGQATTRSVVTASIAVLISDFFLTKLLMLVPTERVLGWLAGGPRVSDEPAIEFRGVRKVFRGTPVLQGVDLAIRTGETFTILGGSGSGKSVCLKHMIGLLEADAGEIRVGGRDVTHLGERGWVAERRRFGMVFQSAALFDSLSVYENVAYPIREHRRDAEEQIRERVRQCLEAVGLAGVEGLHPAELSGGMRKRVGVARAIALEPEIILYDEPTTGLDPANSRRIGRLIRKLQTDLGVTSVVVTHDMELCYAVSDRIALLSRGRIVVEGPTAEIRGTEHPEMRDFLEGTGDPLPPATSPGTSPAAGSPDV